MSRTRQYIERLTSAGAISSDDLNSVLTGWDIPLDEKITWYEANIWLLAQLDHQEQIVMTCVTDGMSDEEWDEAVEFGRKCLRNGVVPHEYVNVLISRQQECNARLV